MPTKNENIITLGAGQLYFMAPDGSMGDAHEAELTTEAETFDSTDLHVLPPTQSVTFTVEVDPATLWEITQDVRPVLIWAWQKRPKLVRLVLHAKRRRVRKKKNSA